MKKEKVVMIERRKRPRVYYCPRCGAELLRTDIIPECSAAQMKCKKCKTSMIIQRCAESVIVFADRREKKRA